MASFLVPATASGAETSVNDEERSWITPTTPREDASGKPRCAQVGGAFLFAAGYGPALTMGVTSILTWPFQSGLGGNVGSVGGGGGGRNGAVPLVLPVVGPLIYVVHGGRDTLWPILDGSLRARGLALASGVMQAVGIVLFAIDADQASRRQRNKRTVSLSPISIPGGAGVVLALHE